MTVAEVATASKLPKSTAHRLLSVLRDCGYMRQDAENGAYALGPRVATLAAAYAASQSLTRTARPHMEALRRTINETVGLYVRYSDNARVLIERLESSHAMQVVMTPGVPMPLGVGAGGRVLAFSDREARKTGVVITKEERIPNSCGIAAPIFDNAGHVIGAIDVAGPLDRFTPAALRKYEREIKKTAAAISRDLGDPES
jgi:DNA-binding IclR family transcriptional regulator